MGWPWVGHGERAVLIFSLVIRSDTNMGPTNYFIITSVIFKIRPISREFFYFEEVVRLPKDLTCVF